MERLSVLCLLLLLFCSLSGAELLDNEIAEQRKASPERANVEEQPQPCPPDVHAVLREMSAKLATLQCKVETLNQLQGKVEQLQTLNQEQAVNLKKLQSQVDTQQQAQADEVDTLKQQQQEQTAKLKEFKNQVDTQQQVQTAELRSLKTWANVTENQVESLRRDRCVEQVAFSASLLASGFGDTGPFNTDTTLVFRGVISNIGNAYNQHTGLFTAPVRGAYHFEWYIVAAGGSHNSVTGLMKNGELIVTANERQSSGWGTSANGATLLLEPGDVVFLSLWADSKIYDNESHHSSFSGNLLFPM